MTVKRDTSHLKRAKVVAAVKRGIASGELPPGERIATVRELSNHCNVSLSVVQHAMKELMDDGFIECRGASGFYVLEAPAAVPVKKITEKKEERTYLCFTHHSDLVWRKTYEEYDKHREGQLLALFRYARKYPQMVFSCEQAEIARVFFDAHPELLDDAKKLIAEGRLDLYGELSIPDLNMISGESLFRDFELGLEIYRKLFGCTTKYVRMSDAFGMCGQLPQICALCGFEALVAGRLPNAPAGLDTAQPFRWRGMDGKSAVTVVDQLAHSLSHLGYEINVPVIYSGESQLRRGIAAAKQLTGNVWLNYMTEETELRETIFPIIAEANREGGKQIRFGNMAEFLKAFDELPEYVGEFNPTMTGCYTSRIRSKQLIRHAENQLFKAEFVDALAGVKRDLTENWRNLMLGEFHDAACGCHVAKATQGICRRLELASSAFAPAAGKTVVNFNNISVPQYIEADFVPAGVPVQKIAEGRFGFVAELPPCGAKKFSARKAQVKEAVKTAPVFDTAAYHVDFITSDPVIINKAGENVFAAHGFGEIVMRFDTGDMWRDKYWSEWHGRKYQTEKVVSCTAGKLFYTVVTEGRVLPEPAKCGNEGNHWPGFESLKFRKEYRFFRELDYFTLKLTLDWHGHDTKIAIRFPTAVNVHNSVATYETPCGAAVRQPYFEVPEEYADTLKTLTHNADYAHAHGDWPALNWVNLSDYTKGLSIANTGTPGHQLTAGIIDISLIRSGVTTADGMITPPVEAYDCGTHEYEFAFRAHAPADMGKAYELGVLLNRKAAAIADTLPEGSALNWDNPNVALSALRRLPDGRILLRLYETTGNESTVTPGGALLEKAELFSASAFGDVQEKFPARKLFFRPFEIKTFVIQQVPRFPKFPQQNKKEKRV